MTATVKNQQPDIFSTARFTQVKRISNKVELSKFYNDCIKRLTNISQWNYMSVFSFAYKITVCNSLGLPVQKEIEKGDLIKMVAHAGSNKTAWFAVENINYQREQDLSEESIEITLSQTDGPKPEAELFSKDIPKNTYQLNLKRLINTISMDIRVGNKKIVDQSAEFLQYFNWDVFSKQILLQL